MKKTINIVSFLICLISLLSHNYVLGEQKETNVVVRGVVLDENKQPLIGATVVGDGTNGTSTNIKGEYQLTVHPNSVIEFQFLGYIAQKINVGTRTRIDVQMEIEGEVVDEVVVIGYGSVRKSDLTGSVTSVKMSDINDIPTSSIDQALQGRIAGADIMSTSGEPGAATSIRIRGTRSITASNEPLIVVDGVIDGVHDINDISPADIQSVSILKDASSTAIYGARGSNGVIVITTKQGRGAMDKTNISFKADFGFSQLPRGLDIMNAAELAQFKNDEALFSTANDNGEIDINTPQSKYPYANPAAKGVGTDWIDEITRLAPYQNYDISVSGKSKKSSYYSSFGYNNTRGIIDNSGLKRYTFRFNADRTFAKWLKSGLRLSYTYHDEDKNLASIGGTKYWESAIYLSPMLDASSDFNDLWDSGRMFTSPIARINMNLDNNRKTTTNNTIYAELAPVKGLKLRSQFSLKTYNRNTYRYSPGNLPGNSQEVGGSATREEWHDMRLSNENTISYNYKSESGHAFDILAGFTVESYFGNNFYLFGRGYTLDELTWNNMGAIPDKQNISLSTSRTEKNNMSVLGRLNYNYKGRYYFTATARYDGASNFAANNKWGLFPSVALKWNVHNEAFMKSVDWVDELAVRLSAGRSGNDAISSYRSLATMGNTTNGYLFDSSQPVAFYPSRLASKDLTWETTDMYNVALDLSIFKNKVRVTAEAYSVYTNDLLLTVQTPTHTGFSNRYANAGITKNKGFELSIETRNITKPKFSWSTSFTLSHNTQTVVDIASEDFVAAYTSPSIAGTSFMMYGYVKDYPLNALWGFRSAGTWKNKDEIDRNKHTHTYASGRESVGYTKYIDTNNDGVLNQSDLVYLGSADPYLYGGIQNTFYINKLTVGVYFNYSLGGKIYNISEIYMGSGSPYTNQYSYMGDAWHPVRNPYSDIPRAGAADGIPSDRMVHDATYLRLKNISVGYTFDMRKVAKGIIRDMKLSVSGENLYLWKRYNGFDPDVSSNSSNSTLRRVDIGAYPKPRTVIFSLQIRY